jgi:hypothetical protein
MMTNRRTYYFPANDCRVTTGLLPNGQYGAYREDEDDGLVRGMGHTRLSAIADLADAVEKLDSIFEREPYEIIAEAAQ